MLTKKIKMTFSFIFCLLLGFVIGAFTFSLNPFLVEIFGDLRQIQILYSPNERYTAELLKRLKIAEFRFVIKVDGTEVYNSTSHTPFADHILRETLIWDKTGRVVVFEEMGRKVFAYDAQEKRVLEVGELERYEFYPMPKDFYGEIK